MQCFQLSQILAIMVSQFYVNFNKGYKDRSDAFSSTLRMFLKFNEKFTSVKCSLSHSSRYSVAKLPIQQQF